MAGKLGCGKYDVYVKTRGGDRFVSRILDLESLKWGRKLNGTSEAGININLKGASDQCCEVVSMIKPWKHELSIFRDGSEVWCGPVVNGEVDVSEGKASFSARDLTAWFEKRFVEVASVDVEFYEADISEVFNWLIEHAYFKDPWNMEWFGTGTLNIPIDRLYTAFAPPAERWGGNYPSVGKELRELSDSGIDFTVMRRTMLSGNLKNNSAATVRLTEKDWRTLPKVRIVGTAMSNNTAIAGGGGGNSGWYDEQMWIERNAASQEEFGLLEYFEAVGDLDDADTTAQPNAVTERARRASAVRSEPYEYLNGGVLTIEAPVTFDQLVPGRHIRVDLNTRCRNVQANYLLAGLEVNLADADEEVTLELVPPGIDQLDSGGSSL